MAGLDIMPLQGQKSGKGGRRGCCCFCNSSQGHRNDTKEGRVNESINGQTFLHFWRRKDERNGDPNSQNGTNERWDLVTKLQEAITAQTAVMSAARSLAPNGFVGCLGELR